MQNELFTQGLTLMALGMGVVFIFLALLVATTQVMSSIIDRYFPAPAIQSIHPTAPSGDIPDSRTLAVIQAAIRRHRPH
jgi:oxaloacetate decarboxylase gamma subunit